jgi:uncharacterized protein (UPF0262 family)
MSAPDDPAGKRPPAPPASRHRLCAVTFDQASVRRGNAHIEHEREVAVYDLLDSNSFALADRDDGPYRLQIGLVDDRLVLSVGNESTEQLVAHVLSLSPLRRVMKDYAIVCESYYQAIRNAPPSRIQSIDMGRRALHDEGSRTLQERLKGKIAVDHDTARRLFTLVYALHWKG